MMHGPVPEALPENMLGALAGTPSSSTGPGAARSAHPLSHAGMRASGSGPDMVPPLGSTLIVPPPGLIVPPEPPPTPLPLVPVPPASGSVRALLPLPPAEHATAAATVQPRSLEFK